jgi:hypothetical protein
VYTRFKWRNLSEVDPLEDLDVDRRVILKFILEKWVGGMNWIDLAQDRDMWRAFVNAVMKLRVL